MYIDTLEQLSTYLQTKQLNWSECYLPSPTEMGKYFSLRLPKFYADLINWKDPNDPLRRMVIPDPRELEARTYELIDPIGDHTHEPVKGLIHRYPDRCLLLLTTHCTIHCRFCFRRDVIGTPLPIDVVGIELYLSSHPEIHEIIFTGGDPATIPVAFLENILSRLKKIDSIDTIRFHTRSMVVDPSVVTDEWLAMLNDLSDKRIVIAFHINHRREVTTELKSLCQKLSALRVTLLSQSVLLKGVNDNEAQLVALFKAIFAIGIKPYYLHHLDKARGTHHFRISIEQGRKLFEKLRGRISSYLMPEYVLDLPGGDGKVPVMWLSSLGGGNYEVLNFEGNKIIYHDEAAI